MVAHDHLNNKFQTNFDVSEVVAKVKTLWMRFSLFDKMISESDVDWDREHNYVFASLEQWKKWREVYPIAKAYMAYEEPLYDEFKLLFGPSEPDEGEDLIVILDNDDEIDLPPQPVEIPPPAVVDVVEELPQPQMNDVYEELSPIEVIDISDDDDVLDYNIDINDSGDEILSLPSSEVTQPEVIDNMTTTVVDDSEEEIMSPVHSISNRSYGTRAIFSDVIPRYIS